MIRDISSLIKSNSIPIYSDKIIPIPVSDELLTIADKVFLSLPPYYRKLLTLDNISRTDFDTIEVTWCVRKDMVSIEISTTHIGFFASLPDGSIKEAIFSIKDEIPSPVISALDAVYRRTT